MPMESGIFCIEKGTSNVFKGILTKNDVLDAVTNQEPYYRGEVHRMIGGSFLSNLKAMLDGW
jgi:hypothetical protein